jgi:hypothetical protein
MLRHTLTHLVLTAETKATTTTTSGLRQA